MTKLQLLTTSLVVASSSATSSCQENHAAVIQIMTGDSSEQQVSFAPKSSLAEYVELPSGGDELRVTLANYELNCDAYAPTPDNGAFVVLTFLLPVGQHFAVGTYPWPGLPRGFLPLLASAS